MNLIDFLTARLDAEQAEAEAAAATASTEVAARDELAALINGRPLPVNPRTIGGMDERDTAYEKADAVIAAGWAPVKAAQREADGVIRATRNIKAGERVYVDLP